MANYKVAYGAKDNIPKALKQGIIPTGTIILTSDSDEIFFYDLDEQLKTYQEKYKFSDRSSAEEWVLKYDCSGQIISVHENDKCKPYVVGYDNKLHPISDDRYVVSDKDPTENDASYELLTHWLNYQSTTLFVLVSVLDGKAIWNCLTTDKIQSDWNVDDENDPRYIRNKPSFSSPATSTSYGLVQFGKSGVKQDVYIYEDGKISIAGSLPIELSEFLNLVYEDPSNNSYGLTVLEKVYNYYYCIKSVESNSSSNDENTVSVLTSSLSPLSISIKEEHNNSTGYLNASIVLYNNSIEFKYNGFGDATIGISSYQWDLAIREVTEDFATIEDVDRKLAELVNTAPETLDTLNELADALGNDPNFATTVAKEIGKKVDKEDGKGLSTNDYTNEEKEKLRGISNGAEANVQPDWNQSDETLSDYIKNKPYIRKTIFILPSGRCYDYTEKREYSLGDVINFESTVSDIAKFKFALLSEEPSYLDYNTVDPREGSEISPCGIELNWYVEETVGILYLHGVDAEKKRNIYGEFMYGDYWSDVIFTWEDINESIVNDYNLRETIYIGLDGYCFGANGIAYPINNLDKDKIMDYNFILVYDGEGYESPYNYHLESAYIPLTVTKISDNGLAAEGYWLRAITLDESNEYLIIEAYIDYELGEVPFFIYPMFNTENGYINSHYGIISVNKKALLGDIGSQTMKEYTDGKIGDIESALDGIIALQNSLIGGDAE